MWESGPVVTSGAVDFPYFTHIGDANVIVDAGATLAINRNQKLADFWHVPPKRTRAREIAERIGHYSRYADQIDRMTEVIDAALAEERERCAKMAEKWHNAIGIGANVIARNIRGSIP